METAAGGSNSNAASGSSNSTASTSAAAGGILPRPLDPNQWWRRGGMRAGFYPHRGMPYMRPGGFFRPRVYPMHHPPPHFAHRKGMPPGWSGMPAPPRMLPPPYLPPPPGVPPPVVPGPAPAQSAEAYMAAAAAATAGVGPWSSAPQPMPTSTTEGDPTGDRKKRKKAVNGNVRPWNREAAEKALEVELECQKSVGANAIVIRFPDPDLSKEIVQGFHSAIENVHFQSPCGPRYCFVMIAKDIDVDKVIEELNQIKFGGGFLKAERKVAKNDEPVAPESIDPFTLYVGNLPTNISTVEVKEKFPTATRIDIGYAQKLKYTRYAFVRYAAASDALEAFKSSVNTVIASRSIILRFRRHKGPVGPKGEKPPPPEIEAKPGEKLTVGAKLKAKRDRLKAEKEKKENGKTKKKKIKLEKEESSSDEEVELENDDEEDEDSAEEEDVEEDDDDDTDDSDDEADDDEEEEDDDDVDDHEHGVNDDDDDDDIDDDDDGPDDDDMYDDGPDDEEYLYKRDFNGEGSWNGSINL